MDAALNFSEGTGTSYSQRLNDQWNVAGIKSNDGYPFITSHYGYHMVAWHTLLALTGQFADLSSPTNTTLTFRPKRQCDGKGGYELPVLLPEALGVFTCARSGARRDYTFALTTGALKLATLSVDGTTYASQGTITRIVAGQAPLRWSSGASDE
eukprot:SAG11_NODE_15585_length_573_cov_0.647679_1_plen_154_part_00